MKIETATLEHVAEVARLFDLYRQFYECEPDLKLAVEFIAERITNHESRIFVAMESGRALGFVQLYPSFCSVEAIRIQILYDLYVDAQVRKDGIGEKLMICASRYAEETGAKRVDLLTAHSNIIGQHLYEKLGYKIENLDFHAYSLYL
jgi:ribosomal protein S18 acetylase RimI-like enzyme